MPSRQDAPPAHETDSPTPAQAQASPASSLVEAALPASGARQQALRLAEASRALWVATLSLMTAFMQTPAPAHRYLLARRISRNFDTLSRQDCFDTGCRGSFERLSRRWQAQSERFAPEGPRPATGLLRLFS